MAILWDNGQGWSEVEGWGETNEPFILWADVAVWDNGAWWSE